MTKTYSAVVHRFALFTVCWTILLFVAGALVTSKDAALSVTDWPKSHGTWVPALSMLQGGDLFEFSHRVVAGGLGLLTIALAVLLWVKEKRPWLRWLGLIAVLGVAVQAILGGQVVIRLLHYWLPVIHACFAQIVFGAVLGIAVFTSKWWISDQPQLEDNGRNAFDSFSGDPQRRRHLSAGDSWRRLPAQGNSDLAAHGGRHAGARNGDLDSTHAA